DIQQQFGRYTNLSVAYVGSHNLRLDIGGSYNTALVPGPGPVSARNLFPYAPVSRWERSIGQSSYNSLQVKTERRVAYGFSGMLVQQGRLRRAGSVHVRHGRPQHREDRSAEERRPVAVP